MRSADASVLESSNEQDSAHVRHALSIATRVAFVLEMEIALMEHVSVTVTETFPLQKTSNQSIYL